MKTFEVSETSKVNANHPISKFTFPDGGKEHIQLARIVKYNQIILTLLALSCAILTIRAEYLGPATHIYLFKPLTMAFIILMAVRVRFSHPSRYAGFILAGLIFSLAGDVFLMLPSDQFIAGLVSFLITHLFYIAAFTRDKRIRVSMSILPFMIYGVIMYAVLYPHLGTMRLPVAAYVVVILIMGWQACDRWTFSRDTFTLLAFLGAVVFIFSDSVLALNKFREHFETARALNLSTYFTAQWMIAISVKPKVHL